MYIYIYSEHMVKTWWRHGALRLHHGFEVVDASAFHLGVGQIFGAAKVDELHIALRVSRLDFRM